MKKGFFDKNNDEWVIPITDRKGKKLNLKKGRMHTARDKYSQKVKRFQVRKLVWGQQSDNPEKIIVLEEIVWDDNRHELRLGYYTTSKSGHWWWGQYALMIPQKDLEEILRYAMDKRMLNNFC